MTLTCLHLQRLFVQRRSLLQVLELKTLTYILGRHIQPTTFCMKSFLTLLCLSSIIASGESSTLSILFPLYPVYTSLKTCHTELLKCYCFVIFFCLWASNQIVHFSSPHIIAPNFLHLFLLILLDKIWSLFSTGGWVRVTASVLEEEKFVKL